MTSPKYIGYLGGAAVAAGVGAAIAVGGAAAAYADTADTKSDSKSDATSTEAKGPKKEPSTRLGKTASKLEQRVTTVAREARDAREARIERVSKFDPADAVKDLQKRFTKAAKAADKADTDVAEDETQQPTRLNLAARAAETARALKPAPAPLAAAAQSEDVTAAASTDDLFSNPFRADDPAPKPAGMFGPFLDIRTAVLDASPDALEPFVREGYEAGYRVSQMVPWVNLPIPLLHIAAAAADPDQRIAQVGINQLLLTLPPVGIAYYGYDQAADLINMEVAAAALKEDFYRTVWDTLDPLELLHDRGNAGLP